MIAIVGAYCIRPEENAKLKTIANIIKHCRRDVVCNVLNIMQLLDSHCRVLPESVEGGAKDDEILQHLFAGQLVEKIHEFSLLFVKRLCLEKDINISSTDILSIKQDE